MQPTVPALATTARRLAAALVLLTGLCGPAAGQDPRTAAVVDARTHFTDRVAVKLVDGLAVRLADGAPTADGALGSERAALAALGRWSRAHRVPLAELDRWRRTAQQRLGRPLGDPALEFHLELAPGVAVADALATLRGLAAVERALAVPRPVRPPGAAVPDLVPLQDHLDPAPDGLGVVASWSVPGATGVGVRLCDVEYSFDASHADLPNVTLVGPPPNDPFLSEAHGTAVLGLVAAVPNAYGTIGTAPNTQLYFAASNTGPGTGTYDVGAAITQAMTVLGPGDVLLIEQQVFGPDTGLGSGCGPGDPLANQPGLLPVEWHEPWYDAIVLAVGNGVVVVEAAGNGQVDLDDPALQVGHAPFAPANDSGAIMVGAGHAPGSTDVARSRWCFSNHGSTVDLQAWGGGVVSTGFGDLYSASGEDQFYTAQFLGTSSASALVAGLCAQVQGVARATTGGPLTPAQTLAVLRTGALPQQSGAFPADQTIGPQPDLAAALVPDCDGDGVPDAIELARGDATDLDGNGVPDDCVPPPLFGRPLALSVAAGGAQSLELRAGAARAGQAFLLLGSLSGTAPPVVDPVTGIAVPLAFDPYFELLLTQLGAGVVAPAVGLLDAAGEAGASVVVPAATDPSFAGLTAHHAFVTVDVFGSGLLTFASNPLPLALAP